jgi:hypothetical protein
MVSNFCKVIHCKGSSFSIKKNNVFQNTIIVLTCVSTSIYIVKFEKKIFKMEDQKSSSSLKAVIAVLAVLLVGSLIYIFKVTSEVKRFKQN